MRGDSGSTLSVGAEWGGGGGEGSGSSNVNGVM